MPTRYTFSITTKEKEIKIEFDEFLAQVRRDFPETENNAEAFNQVIRVYLQKIEQIREEPSISESAQEILDEVNCFYLKFEEEQFKCFEKSKDKRKPLDLGIEKKYIFTYCETCKQGKADKIREQYQKKLRGQNIRGLLQLINLFQKFAENGVPSTVYFCNRLPNSQIFTGLKTIGCTMYDKDIPVDRCKERPCQYFEEYTIAVQQEFPEQTLKLIEDISKDYKRIEDLSPKKQVESEQVDLDDK